MDMMSIGALRTMSSSDLAELKAPVAVIDTNGERVACVVPFRQWCDIHLATVQAGIKLLEETTPISWTANLAGRVEFASELMEATK